MQEKPFLGIIRHWHKVPSDEGLGYYIWGEFVAHPDFGNKITNSSPVYVHNLETGDIETRNSKYKLEGAEVDFTSDQVIAWMSEVKTGENQPNQAVEDGVKQFNAILDEYKRLFSVFERLEKHLPMSLEDQVALLGVACNRVFGP